MVHILHAVEVDLVVLTLSFPLHGQPLRLNLTAVACRGHQLGSGDVPQAPPWPSPPSSGRHGCRSYPARTCPCRAPRP